MHAIPPKRRAAAPNPKEKSADTTLSAAFRSALRGEAKKPHSVADTQSGLVGSNKQDLRSERADKARRPVPVGKAAFAPRKGHR